MAAGKSKSQRRRRAQRRHQPRLPVAPEKRALIDQRRLLVGVAVVAFCLAVWAASILIPALLGIQWLAVTLGCVVPIVEVLVWGAIYRRSHPDPPANPNESSWNSVDVPIF